MQLSSVERLRADAKFRREPLMNLCIASTYKSIYVTIKPKATYFNTTAQPPPSVGKTKAIKRYSSRNGAATCRVNIKDLAYLIQMLCPDGVMVKIQDNNSESAKKLDWVAANIQRLRFLGFSQNFTEIRFE